MFVLVTLLMPRGIIGTLQHWWAPWRAQRAEAKAERAAASPQTNPAE
jgi:urea transport system permease protein